MCGGSLFYKFKIMRISQQKRRNNAEEETLAFLNFGRMPHWTDSFDESEVRVAKASGHFGFNQIEAGPDSTFGTHRTSCGLPTHTVTFPSFNQQIDNFPAHPELNNMFENVVNPAMHVC